MHGAELAKCCLFREDTVIVADGIPATMLPLRRDG